MRQTVMRFASAAARDSALSGVIVEGMVAYLKDINMCTVYDGSAWWTTERATSAATSYSPVLTQLGTVATSIVVGEYSVVNGWCDYAFKLSCNGVGGSGSNVVLVSLPLTALAAGDRPVGSGVIYEQAGNFTWTGTWLLQSTTKLGLQAGGSGLTNYWGLTPVTGLTSGCSVVGHARYRIASAA